MTYAEIMVWFASRGNWPKSPRTVRTMIGVPEVTLDHMAELGLLHRSGYGDCSSYSLKDWKSYQPRRAA